MPDGLHGAWGALRGKRVLVVEDDYLIAVDLMDLLATAGAVPVGPVGWLAAALARLRDAAPALDLAVLDVDLHGERSYPIADALMGHGIPFVFITGFGVDAIDPRYAAHPHVAKPVATRRLLQTLTRLAASGRAPL